jgi:hypothetical protein
MSKINLDKFYTISSISKKCIDTVFNLFDKDSFDFIIEPSAGNGSFYLQISFTDKIGIDIKPDHSSIIKQDFLLYLPPLNKKNILTIGNPPFGKNSSLAIKFFNHASSFSNIIAFIVPRTFRKISIQNKLNLNLDLIYDEDIPIRPCSFEPKMSAKCCFQIWQKKDKKRNIIHLPIEHTDWIFLPYGPKDNNNQPTSPENADFAIRAYGGKIGEIKTENLRLLRPKSWHWIKSNIDKNTLLSRLNKLNFSNSLNTARQNSMGKAELVDLYTIFVNSKL